MKQDTYPSYIMYCACSVDGFIAREDGSPDWFFDWGPASAGYGELLESVDGLVMGAKTYEHVLTSGGWPYGDKPCFVLSNLAREPVRSCIEFFTGRVEEALDLMKAKELKRVWIVGGTSTFTQFHRKRLIDDYVIAIIPLMLGSGLPIIQACDTEVRLSLVNSRALETGLVLNHYRTV